MVTMHCYLHDAWHVPCAYTYTLYRFISIARYVSKCLRIDFGGKEY